MLPFSVLVAFLCTSSAMGAAGVDAPMLEGASAPTQGHTAYLHRTWQFEDGLPHDTVHAIVQTRDGYLWVGTPEGLARFDGNQFTVFRPENTPGLKSVMIRELLETRDGSPCRKRRRT